MCSSYWPHKVNIYFSFSKVDFSILTLSFSLFSDSSRMKLAIIIFSSNSSKKSPTYNLNFSVRFRNRPKCCLEKFVKFFIDSYFCEIYQFLFAFTPIFLKNGSSLTAEASMSSFTFLSFFSFSKTFTNLGFLVSKVDLIYFHYLSPKLLSLRDDIVSTIGFKI